MEPFGVDGLPSRKRNVAAEGVARTADVNGPIRHRSMSREDWNPSYTFGTDEY